MTVLVNIGRRVPRSWYRRTATKIKGLLTFQENIWQIISQSMDKVKRRSKGHESIVINKTKDVEIEDLHYQIEWIKMTIRGTPEEEEEEYNEAMMLYDKLGNKFKKEFPKDDKLSKFFNSKFLSPLEIKDAYDKGYGTMENNNISNKLLEMGILTQIKWNKDFEARF